MNNRSMRFGKLMKAMGLPEQQEEVEPVQEEQVVRQMAPKKIEALTGSEHPELKEQRRMKMLIDSKISQLEESDDPNALETLNFWKQRRAQLVDD